MLRKAVSSLLPLATKKRCCYQSGYLLQVPMPAADTRRAMTSSSQGKGQAVTVGGDGGSLWKNFITAPNTPAGFTLKTAFDAKTNPSGMTTMMEMWKAGSAEPPHSHPGDDMTIVIEGQMDIQFFSKDKAGKLVKDGAKLTLNAGQTGYIAANRIHDATYVKDCKLIYVHSGGFGFDGH